MRGTAGLTRSEEVVKRDTIERNISSILFGHQLIVFF